MKGNFENIAFEKENGIAKIVITKPPLNILDIRTIQEIISALEDANHDKGIFVVTVTGDGNRAFSAGVDISAHLPPKIDETLAEFHKMFHVLANLHKPTIAIVNGVALGGGCELAMGCDLIIASENAKVGQPEIKVGAIPTVAAALLPKLIGRKQALELILTGDIITATRAMELGLVNSVVPAEELDKAVDELVQKLRDLSPIVLSLVREAVYHGIDSEFKKALDGVTDIYLTKLMRTEDAVEGLTAFLEKRKPEWKGR